MNRALQTSLLLLLVAPLVIYLDTREAPERPSGRPLPFEIVEGFTPLEPAPRAPRLLRSERAFEDLFGAPPPPRLDLEEGVFLWSGAGRPTRVRSEGERLSVTCGEGAPALIYVRRVPSMPDDTTLIVLDELLDEALEEELEAAQEGASP